MNHTFGIEALGLVTALSLATPAQAQTNSVVAAEEAAVVSAGSVVIEGETAVIGVRVYRRSGATWLLEDQLTPNDPENNAACAASLAISGDTIGVGAPLDGVSDPGSVG